MKKKLKEHENNKSVDWDRLQSWLQEAAMALDYCVLLAAGKRTGDIEGALKGHDCFKMQFIADDMEISEERIRGYVANIGRLAEVGWKTNEDFPFFASIEHTKEESYV